MAIIFALILSFIFSSSFAQYPKIIINQGDSVVAILPGQLKTLNSQIALLIEYKKGCDSTIAQGDALIESYKRNETDLRQLIVNQTTIIENNDTEIGNLKQIQKNKNRAWIKRLIYGTTGGAVVGLVAGILIAK